MKLDANDIAALMALLSRTHRFQEQVKADQAVVQELQARIAQANMNSNKAIAALAVFGIEAPQGGNVWDAVKEALGPARYAEALEIGKRPEGQLRIEDKSTTQDGLADSEDADPSEDDPSVISEASSPKIGDAILEYLRMVGKNGARVSELKHHLSSTYGLETHEKTPGMTLYRLSQQEPPLVRREGRVWYAASELPAHGAAE